MLVFGSISQAFGVTSWYRPAAIIGGRSPGPSQLLARHKLVNDGFRNSERGTQFLGLEAAVLDHGHHIGFGDLQISCCLSRGHDVWNCRASGTGRGLSAYLASGTGIAGKTGTTDELRDSWFAGFSGDKVAVTWIGRDDNRPAGLSGASGALQVWGDMMSGSGVVPLELNRPGDVELVRVDAVSGLRADRGCDSAAEYPFIRGSAPTRDAPCAVGGEGQGSRLWRSLFE